MRKLFTLSNASLVMATLALLMAMLSIAPHSRVAANTVYTLSIWSEDQDREEVTLRYLGIIRIASCAGGHDLEALKVRCTNGRYKATYSASSSSRQTLACVAPFNDVTHNGRCVRRVRNPTY